MFSGCQRHNGTSTITKRVPLSCAGNRSNFHSAYYSLVASFALLNEAYPDNFDVGFQLHELIELISDVDFKTAGKNPFEVPKEEEIQSGGSEEMGYYCFKTISHYCHLQSG